MSLDEKEIVVEMFEEMKDFIREMEEFINQNQVNEIAVKVRSTVVRSLTCAMIPIDLVVFNPDEIAELRENKYSFVFEVLNTGKTIYERVN